MITVVIIFYAFILIFSFFLQGWPMSDIRPFEALMLLCSYEQRTKETIDPLKLESSEVKLSDLLTQEDFDMVRSVRSFSFQLLISASKFLTWSLLSVLFFIQFYRGFHLQPPFSSFLLLQHIFPTFLTSWH